MEQLDLRVLELLSSRLCHELISPVMAINNGLELLSMDSDQMSTEVADLLTDSGRVAAGRLQFYRLAYGLGGQDTQPVAASEIRGLCDGVLSDSRCDFSWSDADTHEAVDRRRAKLLMNMVLIGAETAPRGGTVQPVEVSPAGIALHVAGDEIRITEEIDQALDPACTTDSLTPRTIHPYYSRVLASSLGLALSVTSENGGISVAARG